MREKSSALRAKEAFMALYHDGKFKPGTKIPSESNMAELLGVSRETWRKALALLRGDGVLYSKHGSGTYLLEQSHRITNDLSQLKSMSRMIEEAGLVEKGSCMTCTVGAGVPVLTADGIDAALSAGTDGSAVIFVFIQPQSSAGKNIRTIAADRFIFTSRKSV